MTPSDVLNLFWMATLIFWAVYWALGRDWGAFLCIIGIHHDKTVRIDGPRQGLSVCVRCARTAEFDFIPNDERID